MKVVFFFFFTHDVVKRRTPFLRRENPTRTLIYPGSFSGTAKRHCVLLGRPPLAQFPRDVEGCRRGGISEAFVATETRALPFYERSRCSTMLETAARVALRSRESAQEVAHFRYRSRSRYNPCIFLLRIWNEIPRFPHRSLARPWDIRVLSKTRRREKYECRLMKTFYSRSLGEKESSAEDSVTNGPKKNGYIIIGE